MLWVGAGLVVMWESEARSKNTTLGLEGCVSEQDGNQGVGMGFFL